MIVLALYFTYVKLLHPCNKFTIANDVVAQWTTDAPHPNCLVL